MALVNMGDLNTRWGVCGFNSALYALYNNSPGLAHGDLDNVATHDVRFLNMIANYLEDLQANGDAALLQGIAEFTRSFDGFSGYSIENYLRRIRFIGKIGATQAVGDFSIAIHPAAVVDFLKRRCGFRNPHVLSPGDPDRQEMILGLEDLAGGMHLYGGLAHYVYKSGAVIHSWGQTFPDVASVAAAGGVGAVCVRIALR